MVTDWQKGFWKGLLRKKARKMIEFIFGILLGFVLGVFFVLLALIRGWIVPIEKGGKK